MSDGKILYSQDDQLYFIKMSGNLRFTLGREFDNLLNMIFCDPEVQDVMIDLREAEYLDSTILGLLAKIANFMIKKFQKKALILSVNENINYLLENIGLSDVFTLIKNGDTPESLKKLPETDRNGWKEALTILDAHRQLVNMNEKNRAAFKDVVELLEKETRGKINS
ncbi:MAG: STAS domain-containing protein [Victivallaceae bacterium]|nr:STAS domain-containing protein [Victivallaceae bacterium]